MDQKLDAITQAIGEILNAIGEINRRLDGIDARLDRIEKKADFTAGALLSPHEQKQYAALAARLLDGDSRRL